MIRACSSCGQKNRVPAEHLADDGVCGRCKVRLAALDEPVDVDVVAFDEITARATVPVLIDFWAPWCGPSGQVVSQQAGAVDAPTLKAWLVGAGA